MPCRFPRKDLATLLVLLPVLTMPMISVPVITASPVRSAELGTSSMNDSDTAFIDNMDIEDEDPPIYIPPVTGAPGDRIGAGTRGPAQRAGKMLLLAPKGGGLTLSESPRLYWWLSADFAGDAEIRIRAADAEQPVLNMKRSMTAKPGLQVFDTSQFGVQLEEGQIYIWTISLVGADGAGVAADSSFVEHKTMDNATPQAKGMEYVRSLAASGYWYDAFGLLSNDPRMAKLRAALLDSAGLNPQVLEE